MQRFLAPLLALTLALAACAPQVQTPVVTPPDVSPATPASTAPLAPQLVVTPHPLLAAFPAQVGDRDAVNLRPSTGGVIIRVRLADSTYSPGWGGEQGQVVPSQGTGIGPLSIGTVIEVLDGAAWTEVARYE